jgi:hypothetical protein
MMGHHSMRRRAGAVTVLILAAAVVGCSSSPPGPQGDVKVTEVTIGRTLEADDTIGNRTDSFWISDTFFVSVTTEGSAPSATLTARWTSEDGNVAAEVTKTVNPSGPLVTELHAPPKEGGWAVGAYKVEVLLNGVSAGTPQELHVRP